jgi:uncharacterized delta-60 repeat protein
MTKPQKSEVISKITKGIVPTTAIASGLLSQPSFGAPGDLDPAFGDMGRVGAGLTLMGPAWSVQALAGDKSLIAGGAIVGFHIFDGCDYNFCHAEGFINEFSPTGSLDLNMDTTAGQLGSVEVLDFALQPDGKVVAVGRTFSKTGAQLTVFRLVSGGGSLDPNFAHQGVMQYGPDSIAQSVILDPSGAIVVGGSSGGKLMVLRLLANGSLDGSFGSGGVYIGPPIDGTHTWPPSDGPPRIHVLRTGSGEYRVNVNLLPTDPNQPSYCAVLALTATGTLNTTFGASGIAAPSPASAASLNCPSMTSQSDGALLLGGREGDHAYVGRLLASGAPDLSFAASAVKANMTAVTALAVDAADSIVVAGQPNVGVSGALIMRLQANGLLDALFGNAGLTWIDLPSSQATGPMLDDLSVLADGRVLAAGGEWSTTNGSQPLLVRLVGTDGTAGPGIIGVTNPLVGVKEQDKTAVMTVRRTGGAAGAVSVAYQTADYKAADAASAISGTDYTPVSGRLTWADGDRSDRQITVPIITDVAQGKVEEAERFNVTLSDPKGGVEIGTQDGVVEIAADGDPVGQFGFADSTLSVSEADGNVQVVVNRNYYSKGAVSVTLTPIAGSATTAEFSATPITLSWADGDQESQIAAIPIVNEKVAKASETFTVDLSNPTNGALIGPHSHLTVTINYDYQPPPPPAPQPAPSGGGGGVFDWLTLLCLSGVRCLRRRAF